MSIREAKIRDLPALIAMARRFHRAKMDRYAFNATDTERTFLTLMDAQNGAVFMAKDGFIAGTTIPALTNASVRTAFEILWWSEGRSGRALRRAFEDWALEQGCDDVVFSFPAAEKTVGALLARSGYDMETTAVRKAMSCA